MAPDAPRDGRIVFEGADLTAAMDASEVAEPIAGAVGGFWTSLATVCGKRTLDISTCDVIEEKSPASDIDQY